MSKTMASTRTYHHGDLRQALIEAACEHLRTSGADTLSLRALARTIGVSQTAPYRHFESKSALFAAIAYYGFELLRVELQAACDKCGDDTEAAILETGLSYVRWAQDNSEKYQLFFDSSLVDFSLHEELIDAGTAAFEVLLNLIETAIEEGILIDKPIVLLAGTLWSTVHGVASLLISMGELAEEEFAMNQPVVGIMRQLSADPRATLEILVKSLKPVGKD